MKFFASVISEMKQVSWTKGKELGRLTFTVVSSIIVLAIFFGIVDLGIGSAIKALLSL